MDPYFDPVAQGDEIDDVCLGFRVDFESMTIVFDGGFSAPIVQMVDRFEMETDDPKEAWAIVIAVPPDGMDTVVYMDDLVQHVVKLH
jgi:hypothetical protein